MIAAISARPGERWLGGQPGLRQGGSGYNHRLVSIIDIHDSISRLDLCFILIVQKTHPKRGISHF